MHPSTFLWSLYHILWERKHLFTDPVNSTRNKIYELENAFWWPVSADAHQGSKTFWSEQGLSGREGALAERYTCKRGLKEENFFFAVGFGISWKSIQGELIKILNASRIIVESIDNSLSRFIASCWLEMLPRRVEVFCGTHWSLERKTCFAACLRVMLALKSLNTTSIAHKCWVIEAKKGSTASNCCPGLEFEW